MSDKPRIVMVLAGHSRGTKGHTLDKWGVLPDWPNTRPGIVEEVEKLKERTYHRKNIGKIRVMPRPGQVWTFEHEPEDEDQSIYPGTGEHVGELDDELCAILQSVGRAKLETIAGENRQKNQTKRKFDREQLEWLREAYMRCRSPMSRKIFLVDLFVFLEGGRR